MHYLDMALVDFYQLAVLYKLRRPDAGFLPIHPRPLPMSATTPPSSSVEPDQAHLSPSPSTQTEFKTPERKRGAGYPVPDITPISLGSSIRQRQEGDTDRVEGYRRGDYDDYIREDLKSRVFVDLEVFMKNVLHVPDDWKTEWGPAIEAVKTDQKFEKHHEEYCQHCGRSSSQEVSFYKPLMNAANAVLDVLSRSTLGDASSGVPQYYHVNDPKKLRGGVINRVSLSPDLVVLHKECQPSKGEQLHWANPLHILEVKPFDGALCDGMNMPRLVVDGIDPVLNHVPPPKPIRYGGDRSTTLATSTTGSESTSSRSRKRPAEGSHAANKRPTKKSRTKSALSQALGDDAGVSVGEEEEGSSSKPETQRQVDPALQVCRYLLEMFSVPLLRSHATVGLVDRDRLQLYHANRSVILVSSAISFSEGDGLNKFIAIIIAFRRLSLKQNGILDTLTKNNTELVQKSEIPKDNKVVQEGNQLQLPGDKPQETFTVTLGDVISRDPATVGRSTVVLKATSDRWLETKLVVKISWPGSGRVPETDFLKKAYEEAEKTDGKWATKHLPRLFYAKDVVFEKDSTFESVASLFTDAKFAKGGYVYERRTLRIIIQEQLHPLKSLTNARHLGQVFLDIVCVHRWLHDCPGILHRDLSPNNIMYRYIEDVNAEGEREQQVYGVLTDYDLSSWTKDLKTDYSRTSQQRTGTPPYMAQELLKGTSTTHLYRHDVESLFYIMLLMCGRHMIGPTKGGPDTEAKFRIVMREGNLPYQKWFSVRDYDTLGSIKGAFFADKRAIELSPAFEDFRAWLRDLRYCFFEGFKCKLSDPSNQEETPRWKVKQAGGSASGVKPAPIPFDDETLGGYVDYSAIIEPTRYLKGELEGLMIRYDRA
ncbi:hypothetical protein BDM02DRAFT_3272377 [Thelephora ganbajun]|uniref:Uncharacterized protein n=1 Tax=Thelephora ganbajun TaxID=370292 RepID=A0ACB6Z5C3_THEGA|nr:hypothetical protein BDM02DRAFT_3272377 [Thelephora ganbajun]